MVPYVQIGDDYHITTDSNTETVDKKHLNYDKIAEFFKNNSDDVVTLKQLLDIEKEKTAGLYYVYIHDNTLFVAFVSHTKHVIMQANSFATVNEIHKSDACNPMPLAMQFLKTCRNPQEVLENFAEYFI